MKAKKIPLRTCVITKESLPKKELLRIVRTPEMEVKVDETGKLNGRGAYIKKDLLVLEKAKKSKILEQEVKILKNQNKMIDLYEKETKIK